MFKEVVVIGSNNVNYFHRNGTFDFSAVSEDRIVLTSYETLRTYQFSLGKIDWSLMVLDEAQRIKNPTALITLAIKAMKYDFGLCLTGTPIENTWIDLWSIMDFAAPGYNLGSLSEFKKNYVNKLKKHSKDEAYIKQLGQSLNNELKPLFKRRLKKTLSEKGGLQELPKKKIIKRKEIMPLTQRLAYENIVNEALGNSVDKKTALEVIAKLRDISLFPDIGTIDERSLSHDSLTHQSARDPHFITQESTVREKLYFQCIHAMHLAGRCTGCGECQRACPVGIPILALRQQIARAVTELFDGYQSGMDPEANPPLLGYEVEEKNIKQREL